MKRMMVAAIGLLPIVAVSVLPQVASAQSALQASTVNAWTVADRRDNDDHRDNNDRRDGWRNRNIDYQRPNDNRYGDDRRGNDRWNYDRRDNDRRDNDRRDHQRRVWIPGHWERGFLGIGRKWVDGHYENR